MCSNIKTSPLKYEKFENFHYRLTNGFNLGISQPSHRVIIHDSTVRIHEIEQSNNSP